MSLASANRESKPAEIVGQRDGQPRLYRGGAHRFPQYAFAAWDEIATRLRSTARYALFLDFDGTLVDFQRNPGDVHTPPKVKAVIERLVRHRNAFVAIVSGRKRRDIQRVIKVTGLHYAGLHGGEMDGTSPQLSARTRAALARARRTAQKQLSPFPEVWIQDKRYSFAIHYRGAASRTVETSNEILLRILDAAGDALHYLNGSRVWEVLPREIPGKSMAVEKLLATLPAGIPVVYIGDDDTDELAFAVLTKQISIRVGRKRGTQAEYYLRGPADVLRFLTRLERTLH